MNDQQARFVRKLKGDQNCSYPTVARKFHQSFGNTQYTNEKDAEAIMYFDTDNVDDGVQVHRFENGDLPVENYRVVEFIFSPDTGKNLCLEACAFLEEDAGEGWLDFVKDYEAVDG